jgi:hypothetical protein
MDIAKCPGLDCPVKELCAHYMIKTDGHTTVWVDAPWDSGAEYCDEFITAKKDFRVPVKVPWLN